MTLSEDILKTRLGSRPFRFYASIGSTNDAARVWLAEGASAGACIIADEQTAGRGRKQRAWHTPPGSAVAVSVILRPTVEALPQVVMLGALAVAETLDGLGLKSVAVKWPNDVLLADKKVCGVLAEASWEGTNLQGVILGIGVNVRVDFTDVETTYPATSIETELGRRVDRADLLAALLARIDFWASQLGSAALFEAWKARLAMLGRTITVKQDHGDLSGTAEDVDDSGVLILRAPDGSLHRVVAGDVTTS